MFSDFALIASRWKAAETETLAGPTAVAPVLVTAAALQTPAITAQVKATAAALTAPVAAARILALSTAKNM